MKIDRRAFLRLASAVPFAAALPHVAWAAASPQVRRLLVLVELKGGNDGLNTVVPFADPLYARLRPRLAIARDQVVQLDERAGLHPSLEKLKAAWDARELAVVQGIGYPDPNFSHFRSIEIWDTASRSDEYLESGWLARAFRQSPSPPGFVADGVVVGGGGMGPLSGSGARAEGDSANLALAHILRVERDVASGRRLRAGRAISTAFPAGPFGNAAGTSAQLAANPAGVAAVRVSLGGFDTHANQAGVHTTLLRQLGDGLAALRDALVEIGRWDTTVVATYSEFGRRPAENPSAGTDHGTAGVHFVMGGRVKGGLHGAAPALDRLDGNGNLPFALDFRSYYATFLDRWWRMDAGRIVGRGFPPIEVI
jgi:uncharacterized protein (DUF1501 family)